MNDLLRICLSVLIAFASSGFQKTAPKKPPAPPVLQGTVRDSEGKAVENALVLAAPVDRSFVYPETPLSTRTAADGRFSLTLKNPSPHSLRVQAPGLAAETLKRVEPGTPLSITLGKGGSIEGTVRDAKTLEPVAAATVEARDSGALSLPSEPEIGGVETQTDEKGIFRIDGLSSGLHHVTARARGYSSAGKESVRAGGRVDLLLLPGSSIVGVVRGPDDRPVEGALVRAEAKGMPGQWIASSPRRADAQGRFELNGVQEGDYNVLVRHPDWAPAIVPNVAVNQESETDLEIVLSRGASLAGRLLNADDRPVRGRVSVQELNGEGTRSIEDLLRVETDGEGQFRIERVPSGSHALAVVAPGYAAERVEVSVGDRVSAVDVGDIKLATGLAIRGKVKDASGFPVVGARVRAYGMRSSMTLGLTGGPRWVETSSESDGSFVLAGLSPGIHRLDVSSPGYGHMNVDRVEAGAENLAIVLKTAGTIRGTVLDPDGRPMDGYQVSAEPVDQSSSSYGFDSASSPEGSFSLNDLAEGIYVVQAHAPGHVTGVVSDVKVTPGAVTDLGRITLKKGGSIRGFVVDPSGAPVPGAKVTIFPPGRDRVVSWGMEPSAISNGEGFFEVPGVPDGTAELVAQHPSYADGRVSGLEVNSRRGATETRVVLSLGGRLEGFVRSRDGSGIAGVTVTAAPSESRTRFGPFGSNQVKSNNDGYFLFETLPAGRIQVYLMRESGAALTSTQRREVEVQEGETAQVEFNLREILVSGRVNRGGAPAGGLYIRLSSFGGSGFTRVGGAPRVSVAAPAAGPQPLNAITREDGSYELLVESPGKYSVMVSSSDFRNRLPTRQVEFPDQDTFALDLVFTGAMVSGIVIDKETEHPIQSAYVGARFHPPPKEYPPPTSPGSTSAGPDGRFELELEPGDYRVSAYHEGYVGEPVYLKVDAAGASRVRLLLARGYSIRGKVVSRYRQPVGGTGVNGTTGEPPETALPGSTGWAHTLADGSFIMEGLGPRRYTLFVDSGSSGFALQTGVKPGGEEVELVLAPGGRARFQVRGADEIPTEGATLQLVSVGGVSLRGGGSSSSTASDGIAEMYLPTGAVEVEVKKDSLKKTVKLQVAPGATVAARVLLP